MLVLLFFNDKARPLEITTGFIVNLSFSINWKIFQNLRCQQMMLMTAYNNPGRSSVLASSRLLMQLKLLLLFFFTVQQIGFQLSTANLGLPPPAPPRPGLQTRRGLQKLSRKLLHHDGRIFPRGYGRYSSS